MPSPFFGKARSKCDIYAQPDPSIAHLGLLDLVSIHHGEYFVPVYFTFTGTDGLHLHPANAGYHRLFPDS